MFVVSGATAGINKVSFNGGYINNLFAVRPVITLNPEVKVSGSGTTSDPYIPSL